MQMFKSLQRGFTLWVQAKTGLTGLLVAWLGIAAAAAIMMFVFLCILVGLGYRLSAPGKAGVIQPVQVRSK
jgi:hypothetical protein